MTSSLCFTFFPLHYTFVRLFPLSLDMRIIRDKTPDIVIVDPFYMRAKLLCSPGDRRLASDYLQDVILANKDKTTSSCLTFPSKSSPHVPVTYMRFLRFWSFFSS